MNKTKYIGQRGRCWSLGALALTLSACATIGPDAALEPINAPKSWAALSTDLSDNAETVTTNWLNDIGDPVVTSLVEEAIANNTNLAASAARVRATRERVGITRSAALPTLSGTLDASSRRSPASTFVDDFTGRETIIGENSSDQYNMGLSARWELDLWGRLLDQTRSAYIGAAAVALDNASLQLSVAGSAAQLYFRLTEARLQRQLSERDVKSGEANLRIIERRYARGISSSLDVRLARSSLAASQATLTNRQQTESESARRLEVLLGRYPSAEIAAAKNLPNIDTLKDNSGYAGSPASLLTRRPDVLASEARLKSAGLDERAARKAFLPTLSLSASAIENELSSRDTSFDYDDAIQNLAANLTQPLFQGGRLRAQARAAKADQEAAIYSYADTVLTAYREVEDALAAEEFLTAQEEAQRLAFEEAAAAEELTTRQYLNGTTNIFDLINAQQRRINNESQFIAASRARLTNRIDLYLALGAPFTLPSDEGQLVAEPAPSTLVQGPKTNSKGDRL